MVAATKLRRTQDAAQNARPYASRMASVIANLAASVSGPGAPRLLVGTGSTQRELVVVATHDRGLAGGFNSSIVRAARDYMATAIAEGRQVSLLTIGRKRRSQAAEASTASGPSAGSSIGDQADAWRAEPRAADIIRGAPCSRPATSTS